MRSKEGELTQIPLSFRSFYPLCDVGQHLGGDSFFDVAVFGWETGLAMLEEVVERRILLYVIVLVTFQ